MAEQNRKIVDHVLTRRLHTNATARSNPLYSYQVDGPLILLRHIFGYVPYLACP